MTNGSWLVMFPKDRLPPEEGVKAALRKIRDATVTKTAAMEFTVAAGKTSFEVALDDASYVVGETKDFVDRNGDSLANRNEVRTFDLRFELLFDHTDMEDLFNPLLSPAEKLAKLTNGVVYESDNGVFHSARTSPHFDVRWCRFHVVKHLQGQGFRQLFVGVDTASRNTVLISYDKLPKHTTIGEFVAATGGGASGVLDLLFAGQLDEDVSGYWAVIERVPVNSRWLPDVLGQHEPDAVPTRLPSFDPAIALPTALGLGIWC